MVNALEMNVNLFLMKLLYSFEKHRYAYYRIK